jgi:hypothetical protein
MADMKVKLHEGFESYALAEQILALLEGRDGNVGLSALNYCMALIIHQQMGGDEEALALSDEQTRYCCKLFRTKGHH